MAKGKLILGIIAIIIIAFLLFTITSPILIVAEDTDEGTPGIDMAAKLSVLGFEWIYPGSSFNANGQTLHNVHLDSPDDPYGAARDIMTYTYDFTPHIIVSVNPTAAEDIFGEGFVDAIRGNDAYNGYAGSENVQGTMSRGDAVSTAMGERSMNVFAIPINILTGNISFHFV